jgi:hypothetical protein
MTLLRRFLLGLGLIPVQDLIDAQGEARSARAEVDRLWGARLPTCVECPTCGDEVDTRTARAL